ncbi:MAG: hypothetical protein DI623_02290 [Sphingomonas sanxanigenens]|uniref:Uncharacterized protein n=1 Tax=Sphingomonas sanxanigenens TaxID=397260 RepID=A0A2W5AEL6_9SPHN|nr:MAG: hypothetical protein DI623_02290 [Sphingomonas sanxanigenens]
MSARRDPAAAIALQLERRAPGVTIAPPRSTPWASVTFNGARHSFSATGDDAAIDALIEGLDCHEFDMRGHIVADIAVADRAPGHCLIEALTVED